MASGNITVRNCQFLAGRGISIGSEVSGGVEDVYVLTVFIRFVAWRTGYLVTGLIQQVVSKHLAGWADRAWAAH